MLTAYVDGKCSFGQREFCWRQQATCWQQHVPGNMLLKTSVHTADEDSHRRQILNRRKPTSLSRSRWNLAGRRSAHHCQISPWSVWTKTENSALPAGNYRVPFLYDSWTLSCWYLIYNVIMMRFQALLVQWRSPTQWRIHSCFCCSTSSGHAVAPVLEGVSQAGVWRVPSTLVSAVEDFLLTILLMDSCDVNCSPYNHSRKRNNGRPSEKGVSS